MGQHRQSRIGYARKPDLLSEVPSLEQNLTSTPSNTRSAYSRSSSALRSSILPPVSTNSPDTGVR